MNKIERIREKNVLFLQGPMGDFFKRMDTVFRKQGANTFKIGLNAGDYFFAHKDNYTPYRGKRENWYNFIESFLTSNQIDMVFLFGDCRFYQSLTIQAAKAHNICVYVFEEGYIRPHYITMELFGVNDHSLINRDPDFYRSLPETEVEQPLHAQQNKFKMNYSASLYYLWSNIFYFRYPYYKHHRDFLAVEEFYFGVRGAIRKSIYPYYENKYLPLIEGELSKKYFFIPLQTHNDFQILRHSQYGSLEKFIIEVLESFAANADKETWLLFKHHPVDRGRKNYRRFIKEQAGEFNVADRVIVVHDLFLPTCIENAIGTITINSTVGLTSVSYGIPTITLGKSIYDMEGLTSKDLSLQEFWHTQKQPDPLLYKKFHNYLIETTQLNGSFYGMLPAEFENIED